MPAIERDTARFDEVRAAVLDGLSRYNDRFLPKNRERIPYALSVRDEAGQIVGGLIGEQRMDWLYVDLLWVDDSQRKQGWGSKLLAEAEAHARTEGLTHIHLSTWQFQAPDFYRAQGFREFGRLENHPAGLTNFYFVKVL